jgi:hypothetical protein
MVWGMPATPSALSLALALAVGLVAASDTPRWEQTSAQGRLKVSLAPQSGAPQLNVFQPWVIQLRDAEGRAVESAAIAIDGGMPAHGHGLPTQPKVTRNLGQGAYLVEGLRFNMAGSWVLRLRIDTPAGRDEVKFDLLIDY